MKKNEKYSDMQELTNASNKANRNRNLILSFAVALAIFVLFSAFSVAKGKVVIDTIKNVRENGSAASAYLENAKEIQYEKLKKLDYINYIGQEYVVGDWNQEDTLLATCEVLDKTGYEEIKKPAYDGIVGHYPIHENEIMLSKKILKKLGLQNPQLGMKISVPIQFKSWSVNDGNELTEEFILSGYYNDYMRESEYVPIVYLSNKYLEKKKIPEYPVKLLIVFKSGFFSNTQMEKQLYQDVPLKDENQQFVGINSAGYQAVNQFIGGYEIAALCTLIVLLSVYLLIYNVLSISLNKDIRYYGLLFTIGLTQKQARKLIFRQNRTVLVRGGIIGAAASLIIGIIGFPILFRGLFLQQKGRINIQMVLYPEILIGSILMVMVLMLLASRHTMNKLKKLSPVEAHRHRAVTVSHFRKMKSKNGASIGRMARYNLFRSKRKFFITLISLFLGCQMALLTVFISTGTDAMNQLSKKSDFKIGTQKDAVNAYLFPYSKVEQLQVDRTKSLFEKGFMEEIVSIEQLDENSVKEIWGCYGSYDFSDEYVQPLEETSYASGTSNTSMTIQVVNNKYIRKLENYIERNKFDIDIDSLRNGNGILVLHKHELSEMSEQKAKEMTGRPAQVYSMDGEGSPEDQGVEFVCSGYLDTTINGFPQLDMSWDGEGVNYFLISEKGFDKLNYPKQIFGFSIDAKKGQETLAKSKLTELIREKNNEEKAANIYYLSSTSDERAKMINYVNNSRTIMFVLCLSLFLLGITNYLNVIITNMVIRKKEFAVMESVGMTKRQLKKMMIMEGVYYWGILLTTLISIGSIMIRGIGVLIKKNLSYFTLVYPMKELIVVAVILLFICVLLPQIVYRKATGKSPIEQLRDEV